VPCREYYIPGELLPSLKEDPSQRTEENFVGAHPETV